MGIKNGYLTITKKNNEKHRCCLCNHPLKKQAFIIINIKWGFVAYTGTECIHKVLDLEYASSSVNKKIEECGFQNPVEVLINSDSSIKKVLDNPCQIIYSCYTQSNRDKVSPIRKNEEWKLINKLEDYDPRGICCAIITWMYNSNHTYITLDVAKEKNRTMEHRKKEILEY